MKFLFTILILCLLYEYCYAIDKEDAKKMFLAALDTCKASISVSEGEIEKIKAYDIVDSHDGKCLVACVMKGTTFMTPDNKLNKDCFMVGVQLMYSDSPDEAKKAEEVGNGCASVTDPDECEAAFKLSSCLKAGREAKGLVLRI